MDTLTPKQISGAIDRAVAVFATYILGILVNKGYLGASDAATFLPIIILLPSILWSLWINRQQAVVQAAAAVPGTTVVTTPALAASTPETNIVSNAVNKVAPR